MKDKTDNRFQRTESLLGKHSIEKLKSSHVAVFGLGGVGGMACEALARSGIGALTLIDGDAVNETNINRQVIALTSTVGKLKTEVMAERIRDINPECRVTIRSDFIMPDDVPALNVGQYDYVVDAIDCISTKIRLAVECDKLGTPVISAMGAGNKISPTSFEIADVYSTSVCPLARVMRRELKARNVKKLKVVYSKEPPITPFHEDREDTDFASASENDKNSTFAKRTTASCAFVPTVCGLILASEVIKDLCNVN